MTFYSLLRITLSGLNKLSTSLERDVMLKRQILVYLMLLSSLPVAVTGFISAFYSSEAVTRQASRFNTITLQQVEKEMNGVFKKIDELMLQYSYENTSLNRFVKEDFDHLNYMMVEDLHTVLRNLHSGLEYVHEIGFYNIPYGKVMTSSGYIFTEWEFNDPAILEKAREVNRRSVWIDTRKSVNDRLPSNLITYTRPIVNGASSIKGMIILYVDANALSMKLLNQGNTDSSYLVVDRSGMIVLHSNPALINQQKVDKELLQHLVPDSDQTERQVQIRSEGVPTLTNIKYSSSHDWFYISTVNMSDLKRESVQLRNIILLISVILVGAAVILSFQAGSRIYLPVQRLMRRVLPPKPSRETDEIQTIISYIDTVENTNIELQNSIDKYNRDVKNHMLLQLLLGNLKDMSPFIDVGLKEPHLVLYLVKLDQMELERDFSRHDQFLYYYSVQNIAEELLQPQGNIMMLMIEPGLFAIVQETTANRESKIVRTCAEQLLEAIRNYLKLTCIISVNYSSAGVGGLPEVYAGGRRALRYRFIFGDNKVIMSCELDAAITFEAATLENLEQKLIQAIQGDEWEMAEQHLRSVIELLSEDYSLSQEGLFAYFSYLLSSILSVVRMQEEYLLDNIAVRDMVFDLSNMRTLSEIEDYFLSRILFVIRSYHRNKNVVSEDETVRQVVDHIHSSYDEDISLQSCAETVGLNTFQLSRMFKKVMGINFIDYVIDYRMKIAIGMLEDPQYKIQDISDKLRYGSVKSFIRVFKKVTGTTPGNYRKEMSNSRVELN
jgi:YesN/AraC family two-component response regulator